MRAGGPARAIDGIAAVIAHEPVADTAQLEKHQRHQQKSDQGVGAEPWTDAGHDFSGKRDHESDRHVADQACIGLDARILLLMGAQAAPGRQADQHGGGEAEQDEDEKFHRAHLSDRRYKSCLRGFGGTV
jgi:hypothetical protein